MKMYEAPNRFHQALGKSRVVQRVGCLLPFSPFRGVVYRLLDKTSRSILDVGCGKGGVVTVLKMHGFHAFMVGIDLYLPYLYKLKTEGLYDEVVLSDARYLPFREGTFDAVLAVDVIEHLNKSDGFKLLRELERIALRHVIVSTPLGFMRMFHKGLKVIKEDLQKNKSGWLPEEFKKLVYKVRGDFWSQSCLETWHIG